MIQKLIQIALRMRWVVFLAALGLVVGGLTAYKNLDIEAYPNPVPPLVEVITQPSGWSAEEVERYVTVPLEIGLAGMPALDHVRSQSLFGLSDVKCYFKWGTDYWAAPSDDERMGPLWSMRLLQLQLTLIYVASGGSNWSPLAAGGGPAIDRDLYISCMRRAGYRESPAAGAPATGR